MRIESELNYFVIVRGIGNCESVFTMFVDGDRASWSSKRTWNAQRFRTKDDAGEALAELKRRAATRKTRQPDALAGRSGEAHSQGDAHE